MENRRQLRIGIDVGGTFTDVVAIDAVNRTIIGFTKVPTSHDAEEGVARGILEAVKEILKRLSIDPAEIVFLAHSTTQATNALLEGDVSRIGIVATGAGLTGWQTSRSARLGDLELAAGRKLKSTFIYLKTNAGDFDRQLGAAIDKLQNEKAGAVVAAEAFSVDSPGIENRIAETARHAGLPATASHEVSSLYGLRLRVRTAAINAAILPKMMETSERTAQGVARSGIDAPLMIMRSDGGVMSLDEMRRRPILSFLSGPAAGIAGALMYEKISDGIFLEVGGTSTDISVIRDGLPQTRPATIGGHRVFLNTLDVRTIGLAGGSMFRVHDGQIAGVGPRSAHIAGCRYLAFSDVEEVRHARIRDIATAGDESNRYLVFETPDGKPIAPTLTCAANYLGYAGEEHYARGNEAATREGFQALANHLSISADDLARQVYEHALAIVEIPLQRLVKEYRLQEEMVELVGGGGGAAAILPALEKKRGWKCRISRHAPIISAIGAGLAMVKEVVERNMINPTDEDVLRVRHEAKTAAIKAGALPETVEVRVEADKQKSIIRAIATGAAEIRESAGGESGRLNDGELLAVAAKSLDLPAKEVKTEAGVEGFRVFRGRQTVSRLRGLWRQRRDAIRVVDTEGVVRLRRNQAEILSTTASNLSGELSRKVAEASAFGDAGQILPDVFLLHSGRIANFSGIPQVEHIAKLAMDEMQGAGEDEPVLVLICQKEFD